MQSSAGADRFYQTPNQVAFGINPGRGKTGKAAKSDVPNSAPSPSRSPPPRARAEPSAAARRELEEEGAFEPLDEEVHATMMEAGAQQRDEAGGGHTPPRSPTPK